jgi:thiosulfate/3-mercaptopyruvate sulfurtransferase
MVNELDGTDGARRRTGATGSDRPTVGPVTAAAELDGLPGPQVFADVRWYLDGTDGRAAFEECHLPGAVWVDLDGDLAAHGLPSVAGRHPLPSPAAFAAAMGALGIGDDTVVVAYDDTGGLSAGRLVVMLRSIGRRATLLDGGLVAWRADGRPTQTGPAQTLPPAAFTSVPWPGSSFADADEVAARAARPEAGRPLIDARAAERFTGEVAVIDPRPGHIPGARNSPWNSVLGADRRLRPVDELRSHYAALGIDAVTASSTIAYCGSGVSACMNVLAMEHAGLTPPRLFTASWSGWASDPDRPAALGPA